MLELKGVDGAPGGAGGAGGRTILPLQVGIMLKVVEFDFQRTNLLES